MKINTKLTAFFYINAILFSLTSISYATQSSEMPIVVTGSQGTVLTSPDGETWTSQKSDTNLPILSLVHANNQYTALASSDSSHIALTSVDATTWTSHYVGGSFSPLSNLIWDGHQYLAVNNSWGDIFTSMDGISWVSRYMGYPTPYNSIAVSSNRQKPIYVAVSYRESAHSCVGHVLTSQDGYSWTQQSQALPCLYNVIWAKGQFVVLAKKGGYADTNETGVLVA